MQLEKSLFVYGSLASGQVHFDKIKSYIVECESAWTLGSVYRLPSGYPAFVLPEKPGDERRINGQFVKVHAPDVVFHLLDQFHGVSPLVPQKSLYSNELARVVTENEKVVEGWVYAMNRSQLPKTAQLIADGDWERDMQTQPLLPLQLTDKQSQYIKRLSNSSGREIVPIDLQLYRELMKLELIVDKGRRLALTKLGVEVARYLPE